MTGKERIRTVLEHHNADKIACDFGGNNVTGMHCLIVERLRRHYGLDDHPVVISDPYQMLGLIEDDLADAIGSDCVGVLGRDDMFGVRHNNLVERRMPWGQVVMLPEKFVLEERNGAIYTYPHGDRNVAPSGLMPDGGYFFDAIERQNGEIDDSKLDVNDNLEEFTPITDEELAYWKGAVDRAAKTGRAVVASFGGTALGDVALIPALFLKAPKGIRSVVEWYMSTVMRPDYIHEIFDRQTDIAIANYEKLYLAVGDAVDVVFTCGTDFGTQDSQFCSLETFAELYQPYYSRLNDWVHRNTSWKTFKHSCGAVMPLVESFIESGFDIINPVQINAKDMEPKVLKERFGDRITFWGGGIDTQKVLPMGTPGQVKDQVFRLCDTFGRNGGFVFNAVHNVQANVPMENVIAMFDALNEIRMLHAH